MEGFFNHLRKHLFTTGMSQKQVQGVEHLAMTLKDWPVPWRAYALATAYHETARTMQPITEIGGTAYFNKYDAGTKLGKDLGNTHKGDGARYRGRGYVQITGRANYRKFGIENDPEKALDLHKATEILMHGMSHGSFTGKKLADFAERDYEGMRKIINGKDKAELIAGYARKFEAAFGQEKDRDGDGDT